MRSQFYTEAYSIIIFLLLLFVPFLYISYILSIINILLILFTIFIFRDPIRITPICENLIVSPSDGYVQQIEHVTDPIKSKGQFYKITFISGILNTRLQYAPALAKVIDITYFKDLFPYKNVITMQKTDGDIVILSQISNELTYKIICDVDLNDLITTGGRIGMIQFGRTVELYIPKKYNILLKKGQSCIGGETIIASKQNNITINDIKFNIA